MKSIHIERNRKFCLMFEIYSLIALAIACSLIFFGPPLSRSLSLGVNRPVGGEMEEEADRQATFKTSLFVGICENFGKFTC